MSNSKFDDKKDEQKETMSSKQETKLGSFGAQGAVTFEQQFKALVDSGRLSDPKIISLLKHFSREGLSKEALDVLKNFTRAIACSSLGVPPIDSITHPDANDILEAALDVSLTHAVNSPHTKSLAGCLTNSSNPYSVAYAYEAQLRIDNSPHIKEQIEFALNDPRKIECILIALRESSDPKVRQYGEELCENLRGDVFAKHVISLYAA